MKRTAWCFAAVGIWLVSGASLVRGDVFGSGANSFEIEFVTIGSPGNPADLSGGGLGAVLYEYRIGKYEISEQMIEKANALGGLGISKSSRGPDKPVTNITWFDAARFVNWLNATSGSVPAYKFNASGNFQLWQPIDPGYDPNNLFRNRQAKYFLPSADEWYKAAYYDPAAGHYWDYPTGSNSPPVAVASGTAAGTAVYNQGDSGGPADISVAGGLGRYGTSAQGGNVDEWEETELDLLNDSISNYRGRRGGSWNGDFFPLEAPVRPGQFPWLSSSATGFRVGSVVPEPSSPVLCIGFVVILAFTKWRRSQRRCAGIKGVRTH